MLGFMKPSNLFLLAALVATPLGCTQSDTIASASPLTVEVKKIDRAALDKHFDSLKGKVVLVNFWATWCGPCVKELPSLVAMQEKYGPQGLQVLGLSIDQIPPTQVAAFAGKKQINYPVLVVSEDAMTKWGSFEAIPMTLLFDRNGKSVWAHEGYASRELFEKQITAALAAK